MQADLRRLALGTALTSTLIVASLLSVSLARAAEECGPLAPTVTCTSTSGVGNPYPDGIEYSPAGDFTLIVDPTVVIDTTGSGMNGISIPDFGDPLPNGDIVVDTAPGSSITADGSGVYVAVETGRSRLPMMPKSPPAILALKPRHMAATAAFKSTMTATLPPR